jgi:hypothetical protein
MSDVYIKNGFKNRKDYLRNLAKDYGVHYTTVCYLASVLGENEDFDGLVSALDDIVGY